MVKKELIFIFIIFSLISCKLTSFKEEGIYAVIKTNLGKIICSLYYDKTPITVGNFVGLAQGTREFKDGNTDKMVKRPFYNGLIFHRIVSSFVIQGGCPFGKGYGDPGYKFVDEIVDSLKFDSAGVLAMANSGPNTNGSQFFITLAPVPQLDGNYTIFGKVVQGMDVAANIGNVKVDQHDKPYNDIFIKEIKIVRVGASAKKFDAELNFAKNKEVIAKMEEEKKKKAEELLKNLGVNESSIVEDKSGLKYFIKRQGTGRMPNSGDTIVANYALYLEDGKKIQSSFDGKEPFDVQIGVGRVISGWDIAFLMMKEGERRILIIPYYLAYGEAGYGMPGQPQIIPPKATLIFDVELIRVKKQ